MKGNYGIDTESDSKKQSLEINYEIRCETFEDLEKVCNVNNIMKEFEICYPVVETKTDNFYCRWASLAWCYLELMLSPLK